MIRLQRRPVTAACFVSFHRDARRVREHAAGPATSNPWKGTDMHSQNTASRSWAQTMLGIPAIVVIGAIAAAMNWRFGQTLGHTELDGMLFGALGVALVALNWILPGAAAHAASRRARLQQAACIFLWIVCAGYTLVSSVGFSAVHRAETGAGRKESSERYDRAKADHERLTGELQAMKASPKYQAAAGCADARSRQADFCDEVKAKEQKLRPRSATWTRAAPLPSTRKPKRLRRSPASGSSKSRPRSLFRSPS